jgi:ribosome-binding factor A
MTGRRLLKAAEAIRGVVSMAILAELKDPRIRNVTVTHVEVSADMRHAKVHVSVMGDDTQQKLSLRGLQSAAGFLQSKIAEQIDTRYTPRLLFILDQGVKKSIEMAQLLKQVLPSETEEPETTDEEAKAETDAEAESDDFPNDEESSQPRRPR